MKYMMIDHSLKASMGKLRHHAYLNRRRTALETMNRAILQLREARVLLGDSDPEEFARKELDGIINSLTQAICLDLQNVATMSDAHPNLLSKQIA